MQKKDKTKSLIKALDIIIGLLVIIAISVIIYKKFQDANTELTDAQKFSKEYTEVSENNVFKYMTSKEIIKILKNGTGVVYLGFPECKWCQAYVPILNEAAKESGIDTIYYFNILEDRKNNTEDYQTIVELLEEHLLFDDEGNPRVFVPDVTIVNKGEIIGHDNESSVVTEEDGTPEEYWTNDKKKALKSRLKSYFNELDQNICTSC